MRTDIRNIPNGETFKLDFPPGSDIFHLMVHPVAGRPVLCYKHSGLNTTERVNRTFQWLTWEDEIKHKQKNMVYIGTVVVPGPNKVITIQHLFEVIPEKIVFEA
jgi:hypothetical protein